MELVEMCPDFLSIYGWNVLIQGAKKKKRRNHIPLFSTSIAIPITLLVINSNLLIHLYDVAHILKLQFFLIFQVLLKAMLLEVTNCKSAGKISSFHGCFAPKIWSLSGIGKSSLFGFQICKASASENETAGSLVP